MTTQDMVQSVLSKVAEGVSGGGVNPHLTEEKLKEIAKMAGYVEGVKGRFVGPGQLKLTDLGLLFIGVSGEELAKAKEKQAMADEIAKLEREIADRKARLAKQHGQAA